MVDNSKVSSNEIGEQVYKADVDAVGLKCPEPVMLLHAAIRDASPGERIRVVATDPSTKKDISNFCEFLGHELERLEEEGDKFIFCVRKGG